MAYRGEARILARGRLAVSHDGRPTRSTATDIVIAVGSVSKVPTPRWHRHIPIWTNSEATLARELPREPAGPRWWADRLRARPGVRPVRGADDGRPVRAAARADRPSAQLGGDQGRARSATVWTSDSAFGRCGLGPAPGRMARTSIDLDDGSTAKGHVVLLAVGRTFPIDDLGLEHYGVDTTGRTPYPRDGRLRVADGLWTCGDAAGPELHTHQGHYQGELAVRMALGEPVNPTTARCPGRRTRIRRRRRSA